jgi:putative hydrolase of the HAD superfamily
MSLLPAGEVHAVVLDAGGVLLVPDPEAVRRELAPFDVTPDDETCLRAHYASMREVDIAGGPDWPRVDRCFARAVGVREHHVEDAVACIDDIYMHDRWTPVAGAAEALLALQDLGVPLAVVSNASGTMEEQLLSQQICSVDGHTVARVAIVVDSHVVGVEKPDPKIFSFALEALGGVPPEGCVYVGDTVAFDVIGARAAGLRPIHLDPYGFCPGTDDHAHATSLGEVVAAVTAEVSL